MFTNIDPKMLYFNPKNAILDVFVSVCKSSVCKEARKKMLNSTLKGR